MTVRELGERSDLVTERQAASELGVRPDRLRLPEPVALLSPAGVKLYERAAIREWEPEAQVGGTRVCLPVYVESGEPVENPYRTLCRHLYGCWVMDAERNRWNGDGPAWRWGQVDLTPEIRETFPPCGHCH